MTQLADRCRTFRLLHESGCFIVPNPWDLGTARLLELLGFEALATTSAGYAFSAGKQDTAVSRDEMLVHAASLAASTDFPVSADLENGYGDTPDDVAETYRLAVATQLAGASIEDRQKAVTGLFTFVAVDKHKQPVPILG